jgi:hypothetical protein
MVIDIDEHLNKPLNEHPNAPPGELRNPSRLDMPWTKVIEQELVQLEERCLDYSQSHTRAMKRAKCRYTVFGLPSMLIPLVTGGIGSYIPTQYEWISSTALIVTAINSAIIQFFNFGNKQNKHSEASNRYTELAGMINMELAKPDPFRISCDVFVERITVKYQNLQNSAPDL